MLSFVRKAMSVVTSMLLLMMTCASGSHSEGEPSQVKELIVCDGGNVVFECQPGERLRIFSARYGVTTILSQCTGKEYSSEYVPCWKDIALNDIQCTSYQTCRLQPPKDPHMYKPDPCIKISTKYLNVTYSCLIGETPTEPPPVSVVDECQCPCDDVGPNQWGYLQDLGLTLEEMREIMMPFLESLKDNVTIDRKATSKFLRSKMSAADHRSSTTSIGSAGVVIIVTVIALLVVVDVLDVCVWFKQRFVAKSKVAVQNQGNPADELLS